MSALAPPPDGPSPALMASATKAVPVQAPRRAAALSARSPWTWTDVLPIVVLAIPAARLAQLAMAQALRSAGLPVTGSGRSLLLDVIGYGAQALLIWLFLGLRRRASLGDLGLGRPTRPWLGSAVAAWGLANLVGNLLYDAGAAVLPTSPPNQCLGIEAAFGGGGAAVVLLGVAVVPPLVEEVLFRGVVFGWLRGRVRLAAAVPVSAALFAGAHVTWMQWTLLPPLFGVGCVLAMLYHRSGSLWPCILAHAAVNAASTLALPTGPGGC